MKRFLKVIIQAYLMKCLYEFIKGFIHGLKEGE